MAIPAVTAPGSRLGWPTTGLIDQLTRHFPALAACTLVFLLGIAAADDYGVLRDTYDQRAMGEATLRHLAGEGGLNLLRVPSTRLYGPIFEAPLALVERILGRDDSRSLYLVRYLLTHLFFLVSGFTGYLLAWRLFGSRWLALFALALFLLHPRIYAQSFFNSKDIPFLAMFMICLWLTHRAFGSSSPSGTGSSGNGAFALCGIAAGLLTNLRIMGLAFVALVVFMRLCDVVTGSPGERRGAIASCTLFALAAAAAYYATMPYLWADPVGRFVEVATVLPANNLTHLFVGKLAQASEVPPSHLPVWFGVTTPPLALLFGSVGLAALVWRVAARPKACWGNTPLRFELLVAACVVLPMLAAIAMRPPLYGSWRHFYFLWAPFALLATSGLKAPCNALRRYARPRVPTVVVACLATIVVAANAYEMVRLHPHQFLYLNALAKRAGTTVAPDHRFRIGPVTSEERGYAHILEELAIHEADPDAVFNIRWRTPNRKQRRTTPLGVGMDYGNMELLSERDRQRFVYDPNADIDFYVVDMSASDGQIFPPLLYERRIYGQPIVRVATPDLSRVDEATANVYRALYREVTSGAPALSGLSGDIDVYRDETTISWVRRPCPPGGVNHRMTMSVVLLDSNRDRTHAGFAHGVRVGDACLWRTPLPARPIAKIIFPYMGALASDAHIEERRRQHRALSAMPPAARSTFDVYLDDGTLIYVKTPCVQEDTQAPFFVHVRPVHAGDLHRSRRPHGFDTLDFRFGGLDPHWNYAVSDIFDDVCMATLELPDYPIASVATGQYVPGSASLWNVEVGG